MGLMSMPTTGSAPRFSAATENSPLPHPEIEERLTGQAVCPQQPTERFLRLISRFGRENDREAVQFSPKSNASPNQAASC
jgi:hypothetical protein